ncbi:MAG: hypothetical protein COB50_04400 [Thiotrichales bacterium]|nr:MAG: hypothetical protein COB50_04400 [Thiotrichales bacterium]
MFGFGVSSVFTNAKIGELLATEGAKIIGCTMYNYGKITGQKCGTYLWGDLHNASGASIQSKHKTKLLSLCEIINDGKLDSKESMQILGSLITSGNIAAEKLLIKNRITKITDGSIKYKNAKIITVELEQQGTIKPLNSEHSVLDVLVKKSAKLSGNVAGDYVKIKAEQANISKFVIGNKSLSIISDSLDLSGVLANKQGVDKYVQQTLLRYQQKLITATLAWQNITDLSKELAEYCDIKFMQRLNALNIPVEDKLQGLVASLQAVVSSDNKINLEITNISSSKASKILTANKVVTSAFQSKINNVVANKFTAKSSLLNINNIDATKVGLDARNTKSTGKLYADKEITNSSKIFKNDGRIRANQITFSDGEVINNNKITADRIIAKVDKFTSKKKLRGNFIDIKAETVKITGLVKSKEFKVDGECADIDAKIATETLNVTSSKSRINHQRIYASENCAIDMNLDCVPLEELTFPGTVYIKSKSELIFTHAIQAQNIVISAPKVTFRAKLAANNITIDTPCFAGIKFLRANKLLSLQVTNDFVFDTEFKFSGSLKLHTTGTVKTTAPMRANGYIDITAKYYSLKQCKLVAGEYINLSSATSCDFVDCSLGCNQGVKLTAMQDVVVKNSDIKILDGNFIVKSNTLFDCIASNITLKQDALFEVPQANLRLLTQKFSGGQKAISKPSCVILGGKLTTTGGLHLFGSKLHCNDYQGQGAQIEDFQAYHTQVKSYQVMVRSGSAFRHATYATRYSYYIVNAKLCPGVHSYGGQEYRANNRQLTIRGTLAAAYNIVINFEYGQIGQVVNIPTVKQREFKQVVPFKGLDVSGLYNINRDANLPYIISYDIPRFSLSCLSIAPLLPPPVVISPAGFSTDLSDMRFLLSPRLEMHQNHRQFFNQINRGFLNDKINTDEKLHIYMRQQAHKYMLNNSTICLNNDNKIPAITEPMLFYQQTTYEHENGDKEQALTYVAVYPKSLQNNTDRFIGGIYAGNNIILIGSNGSNILVTGEINAANLLAIEADDITITKRQQSTKHVVPFASASRDWVGSGFSLEYKVMYEIAHQKDTGKIAGNQISVKANNLTCIGAHIKVGNKGLLVNTKNRINILPAIDQRLEYYNTAAKTALKQKSTTGAVYRYSSVPTIIVSNGDVALISDNTAKSVATKIHAVGNLTFYAANNLLLDTILITEQLAPNYSKKGMSITATSGTKQKADTNEFIANGNIILGTKGKFTATAPKLMAKTIEITGKNVLFNAQKLLHTFKSSTSGISGFSYIKCKVAESHEDGLTPSFMAEDLKINAEEITLIAPELFITNSLKLQAKQSVNIKALTLKHRKLIEQYSLGVNFFCSDVLEGAICGDFAQAARALVSKFPWLDSVCSLAESKEKSDIMINASKTLYNTYKTFKSWGDKVNFNEFLDSQGLRRVGVGFNQSSTEHNWTTLILPWLQAKEIIIAAGVDVNLESVSGKADNLTVAANNNINFTTAFTTSKTVSESSGFNISANFGGEQTTVSAGVSFAEAESDSKQFVNSHFKIINELYLTAGNNLNIENVLFAAKKALIKAKNLKIKSLQNISSAKSSSVGINVGPGGLGGNLSGSKASMAWVLHQAGLDVSDELMIDVTDETWLEGAILNLGNGGIGRLKTAILKYKNLDDKDVSKSLSISGGAGQALTAKFNSHDKRQKTRATVSNNIIIISDSIDNIGNDDEPLNRDINKSQETTKDAKHSIDVFIPKEVLAKLKQSIKSPTNEVNHEQEKVDAEIVEVENVIDDVVENISLELKSKDIKMRDEDIRREVLELEQDRSLQPKSKKTVMLAPQVKAKAKNKVKKSGIKTM